MNISLQSSPLSGVAVFDSGVGGLSILKEIRHVLPQETLHYLADDEYVPYGDRTEAEITARSLWLIEQLIQLPIKAIVVACNTATTVAIEAMRRQYSLPIIGVEPAVRPAIVRHHCQRIGVMATTRTLSSQQFMERLLEWVTPEVTIFPQACPGLVEYIEKGDLASEDMRQKVMQYLQPLIDQQCDCIVLGCTHYPFLSPLIQSLVGKHVKILDSAEGVALHLKHVLENDGLSNTVNVAGETHFYVTKDCQYLKQHLPKFWGNASAVQQLVSIN